MIFLGLLFLGVGIYGLLVERFLLFYEMYISLIFASLLVFAMAIGNAAISVGLVVVLVMILVTSIFAVFYKRTRKKNQCSIDEFQLR